MAHFQAMSQSAEIVAQDSAIKVVVVSATSGTTNQLLQCFHLLLERKKEALHQSLNTLEEKHIAIALEMKCDDIEFKSLKKIFQDLRLLIAQIETGLFENRQIENQQNSDKELDQLLSFGELLSSHLFTLLLKKKQISTTFFDVRKIMRTTDHFGKAEPCVDEVGKLSQLHLVPLLESHTVVVTQGFIGATAEGDTTTLGRGGSDYSAAIIAESLEANVLQIWTDVPGIFTIDPNCVPGARAIPRISFGEAAELANFGAKVLHPATLWPAIRKKIQVFVGSTFNPNGGGTWIFSELEETPAIRAIAMRKNQTLVTVTSLNMLNVYGFLAKLFEVLARYRFSVDLVTTSEVSVALTIDGTNLGSSGQGISAKEAMLKELGSFSKVDVEKDLSLVAVIGNRLNRTPGVCAKAFQLISEFNLRLLCHGASDHNLCFLVKEEVASQVASLLHQNLIESKEGFEK